MAETDEYIPTEEDLHALTDELERADGVGSWGIWASEPELDRRSPPALSALTEHEWRELDDRSRRDAIAQILTGSSRRQISPQQQPLADELLHWGSNLPVRQFRFLLPKRLEELALRQAESINPLNPIPAPAATPEVVAPTLYELWEQHWETLARLTSAKKVARTKDDERGHACRLNILSENKPINRLTLDDFNRIYLQILDIRISRGRRLPQPDAPTTSIIAEAGERRIGAATADKLITRLKVLHAFAYKKGMTSINPESTDKPSVDFSPVGTAPAEKAFSATDLEAIFSGYLYTGQDIGSSRGLYPYQFWLPLLGLFTGGRLNELCQLDTEDVEQHADTGIWSISIIDDPKDRPVRKMLKNKSSRRVLPIHSELVRIGFLEFVEQARLEGREKLFSDGLRYNVMKGWGGRATHFFCRFPSPSTKAAGYLYNLGIRSRDEEGNTDRKNFHSFRHTFTDLARAAGAEAYLILPDLTGHSRQKEGMVPNYGNGFSLTTKQSVLESLTIPVNLSSISYTDFIERLGDQLHRSIAAHRKEFALNQSEHPA